MSGYRPRGSEVWRVEVQDDGLYDIYQGRRRRKAGVDYIFMIRYLRREIGPGHKVVMVEPDGYETTITRTVQRGG